MHKRRCVIIVLRRIRAGIKRKAKKVATKVKRQRES